MNGIAEVHRTAANEREFDLPVAAQTSGRHVLTAAEKEEIKTHAVNGVIPLWDYIRVSTDILNRKKAMPGVFSESF